MAKKSKPKQPFTIEYVAPESLVAYDRNAKAHPPHQIAALAKQIKAHGFDVPIVVWKDNLIVKGHGRVLAAQVAALKSVPIIRREDLTEAQVKAVRIADNKVGETFWLQDILKLELGGLSDMGFEMELTGFAELEAFNLTHEPEEAEGGSAEGTQAQHEQNRAEWQQMPDCDSEDLRPKSQLIVSFRSDADRLAFHNLIMQPNLSLGIKSTWHPAKPKDKTADIGWGDGERT